MRTYQYRIHPGIGIARVGNSPDSRYFGPEAPGIVPEGPYKDGEGRIARQAVRFRIYRYSYDAGELTSVKEITATDKIKIHWSVHLANRKAAAPQFPPIINRDRNENTVPADERHQLVIDAGNQSISGTGNSKSLAGSFLSKSVPLGDLETDDEGRLIALGGFGMSSSVPDGLPVEDFANNVGWYDDTSDGPVTATIEIESGTDRGMHLADSAWLVVAPPAFAPGMSSVVTWYDRAVEMAIVKGASIEPTEVSFAADILPILSRVAYMRWVDQHVAQGHGPHRRDGYFLDPDYLKRLADNSSAEESARNWVFENINVPDDPNHAGTMPLFNNNGLDPDNPLVRVPPSLTKLQIRKLRAWSKGKFIADYDVADPPRPAPFEDLKIADRPAALDKAALDVCIGGPFFPGIECGYIMARPETYDRPLRISRRLAPGDVTSGLAVPWQADFYDCRSGFEKTWWPAARPNQVFRNGVTNAVDWVPSWFEKKPMVDNWWMLGFIVQQGVTDDFRETERDSRLDLTS